MGKKKKSQGARKLGGDAPPPLKPAKDDADSLDELSNDPAADSQTMINDGDNPTAESSQDLGNNAGGDDDEDAQSSAFGSTRMNYFTDRGVEPQTADTELDSQFDYNAVEEETAEEETAPVESKPFQSGDALLDKLQQVNMSRYSSRNSVHSDTSEPEAQNSPDGGTKRKILIIGGGIAGLVMALSIKHLSATHGMHLIPIVYEKNTNFSHFKESYMLWKWAVEILSELGLGEALGKISCPVDSFKSLDSDTMNTIVQWPPKWQPMKSTDIPSMLAIRKQDLVRLLLKALSGYGNEDGKVVRKDSEYLQRKANNSDFAGTEVTGVEGDLALEKWFQREKWRRALSQVNMGYDFKSYAVSNITGTVTANFFTGLTEWSETADMIVGADGIESAVRAQLFQGEVTPDFASACVISGVTRIHMPPPDVADVFPNGKEIPDLTKRDVHDFCPEGIAKSVVGGGGTFGCLPLGNGMIGWNLITAQESPGKNVEGIVMGKTRAALSDALRANPRQSVITPSKSSHPLSFVARDSATKRFSDSRAIYAYDEASTSVTSSRRSSFLEALSENNLEGNEVMGLTLKLSMNLPLPHPCHAIMARSDPDSLAISDVVDFNDQIITTYTSPQSVHPGRVILIGDAAHAVSVNGHGSVGGSLAITDAALLTKLLGKYLNPRSTSRDVDSFRDIAREFDEARVEICNTAVKEARTEGSYGRVENTLLRSFMRIGKWFTPSTWAVASYDTLMTRGACTLKEPSLAPE